jgi:hypothetical protein
MMYGGTSWGSFAAPVVATSYDYSAPISEDRSIGSKYYETKLLGFFLRVAHDLTVTDFIGNSTEYSTNANILTTELRNPNTNAGFYVTIHANSSSETVESFQLRVNTSAGALTIPQHGSSIVLNGHQSKIITTDFSFGSQSLLYSSAEVLTYSIIDEKEVLVLWVPTGEAGEFAIKGASYGTVESCNGCSSVGFYAGNNTLTVTFVQGTGQSVLKLNNGVKVILLDRTFAYKFWVPSLTNDPLTPENLTVLVQGPYLTRSADLSQDGTTLLIEGDLDSTTALEVFAPKAVSSVSWNGKVVQVSRTSYGSLKATLIGFNDTINLPTLTEWKASDSLPERLAGYDDTGIAWVDANHLNTSNPTKPATLPVLYVDEYGKHSRIE